MAVPQSTQFAKPFARLCFVVMVSGLFACSAFAQDPGPLPDPPASRTQAPAQPPAQNQTYHTAPPPARIHSPGDNPITKEPPSIPAEQITQRFAEKEAEFKQERDNYTYTQDFSIQTIDDDGRPDGEHREVSDIIFTPDGKRFEHVTFAPQDSLQRILMTKQDLDDVRNVQPFVLTTTELPKYNVFPRFRTYRENIEKDYWFPVYTRADDYLHFSTGDVHIRMTIRYSNYKRYGSTVKIGTVREVK
jgi:hypothetical protein